MARQPFGSEPGIEFGLVYDGNKVTDLYCDNTTGADVFIVAILEPDQQTGEQRTIGGLMRGSMIVPLPENAVRRSVDAEGEPRFSGLLSIRKRS